jgi:hypothetical protein
VDEIIYLEPDEEITSVIEKIQNAQNSSLGLVIPRDATLLQSVVNLRLLAKQAHSSGKQISIVTADKIGQNLAAQVGLMVYSSIKEERPAIRSARPDSDRDEVLEVDNASPAAAPAPEPEKHRSNFNTHHLKEDRPVIHWKSKQKPVMTTENKNGDKTKPITHANPIHELNHKAGNIIWPILIIILILIGLGTYLIYPAATVQVYVKSDDLNKTLPIVFTGSVTTPNPSQGIFPGLLLSATETSTQTFPATGQQNLGGKAAGQVTLYNGLDSLSHTYAVGTKLTAQGKNFLLNTAVTLPGATVQNLQVVPGHVAAGITAENAGEDYNIKAGKFVISGVPSNEQSAIYAQSTNDLAGGFTKQVQVVSSDDYNNAQKAMTNTLTSTLDQDLKTKGNGLSLVNSALVMSDPDVTSTSNVNQQATQFQMTVKLTKQVMAYNYNNFITFLTQTLSTQTTADKMIVIPSSSDIILSVTKQAYDQSELDVSASVAAKIATKISEDTIKNGILGKSKNAANQFILAQSGVNSVTFDFRPAFWQRFSYLSSNVTVNINYKNGAK